MARSRQARGRRADYRWREWAGSVSSLTTDNSTQATLISASSTFSDTLMRLRGNFVCWLRAAQAGGDITQVAAGIMFVGKGVTATVTPLTEGSASWIWYERFHLFAEVATLGGGQMAGSSLFRSVIDGKAMRKRRPDEDLLFVIETSNVSGAAPIAAQIAGRALFAS